MAKWIDKPTLSAGQLADGDKMLVGDVSEETGSRDATTTLGDLRSFLGADIYDLQLRFLGAPDAGAVDMLLAARDVTISNADPGEVHVGVNPNDGTATLDVQVNGVSVGDIEITTGGVVTWNLAAPIVLEAGDRLALVAPSPADSTLADVLVAFRGVVT